MKSLKTPRSIKNMEKWVLLDCGNYEVSNIGRVRSVSKWIEKRGFNKTPVYQEGKILKDQNNGNGYRYITICHNGIRKNAYIHRLVASSFIDNPHNLPLVNHIDGDKKNNIVQNLEWCNNSHNVKHANRIGLMKTGGDRYNAISVLDIETGMRFGCIKHAADFFGIKYNLLKEALNRTNSKPINPLYRRLKKESL